MTPEQQKANPEQQAEKPYVAAAQEVISKAAESVQGTTERFIGIDSHVDKILQAADDGEITGSNGTYTREMILHQIDGFLVEYYKTDDERKGHDPFTLIPGKDGMRASFKLLMDNDATYRDFEQSLRMHIRAEREKRSELLSAVNIQEMGEVEVSSAGVNEPMAEARRAAEGIIDGIPDHIMNPASSRPVEAVAQPQPSAEQVLEQETPLQTNQRFLRESQAQLQRLYAQHRAVRPGSDESYTLANEIEHAKADVGKFAKVVAKLQGNTTWH